MCGVTGFIDFNKRLGEEELAKMTNSLSHRGPDSAGFEVWVSDYANIGFGHRRLSIIDLSELGNQPMQRGALSIIFNGEIYNYKEIKKELEQCGCIFKSGSDTEVILASFEKWGKAAVEKFIGMFVFAIYDRQKSQISIYRDRAGVKPLYYYTHENVFLFSSELKAFHQIPAFGKKISFSSLMHYLQYGFIPTPLSIYEACFKLPPGHYLTIDLKSGTHDTVKYWDVADYYKLPNIDLSENEILEKTENLLTSAFNYRMVADVPVGVFLSGGYDSSLVTAILQASSAQKINTFTIGFHEEKYNEAHYAKRVADHLGTNHTEYYCTQKEALDIIPRLPYIFDEPFGDSSMIPTTLVSQVARQQVKVALSADGGDEIFAGYNRYRMIGKVHAYTENIPRLFQPFIGNVMSLVNPGFLSGILNKSTFRTYLRMAEVLKNNHTGRLVKMVRQHLTEQEIKHFLSVPCPAADTVFDEVAFSNGHPDFLNKVLSIEYKTYLPDDILVKVDRATMSVGLEGREPFLDQRIIEFLARIPSRIKYKDGNLKYLLKKITHKYIPPEMMEREKKGFGIPVMDWLRKDNPELIASFISEKKLKEEGLFDPKRILKIRDEFLKGEKLVYHRFLWFLFTFEQWYDRWN